MHENDDTNDSGELLGKRLTDEAQELLVEHPGGLPDVWRQAESRRSRRELRRVQASVAAAAAVVVGLVVLDWRLGPGNVAPRPDSTANSARKAPQPKVPRDQIASDAKGVGAGEGALPWGVIPLVVATKGEDGEMEFVPGWYVPERVEELDDELLAPVVHQAASQLLGLDSESSARETI